jgi:hypothetical protein
MNREIVKTSSSYKVEIFIAGNLAIAKNTCESFCTSVGLCVTVTPTTYVYRGGREDGVIVGLINYPRFPKPKDFIVGQAMELAELLKKDLDQGSYTVQDEWTSVFVSTRDEDQ